jgi:hypothetical protein
MNLIILIIILVLLFGGDGGYYAHSYYGLLAESFGQGVRFCYSQVRSRVACGIGKGCETPIFSS